jgi:hypothetical protein
MKKKTFQRLALVGAAALVSSGAPAYGGFGDVVASWPVASNVVPLAAAWTGTYPVGTNNHASGDHLWRVYTTGGSVVNSFASPHTSCNYGAAYLGRSRYWGGSQTLDYIFLFDAGGSVVSSFAASNPYGIAWDGTYLWWLGTEDVFRRCTSTGSVLSSFRVSAISDGRDLGWDGTYLWCPDATDDVVYRFTTVGSITASFRAPNDLTYGCAYDGTYLWLTGISGSPDYFYRVDVRISAVSPTSFGKVKAMFK